MLSSQSKWYLVQCKPGECFRAFTHLENQKYTCFLPTIPVKRKHKGIIQQRIEPFFPHYLFVRLDDSSNWVPIRSTRGVNTIVRFNGVPASIDDDYIDSLKKHCETLHGQGPAPLYTVGDTVLITETCFKNIEAMITATSGEERVTLLFHLCNRPQNIELPIQAVTLVS